MACPALPLCGLAVTEAERRMPEWNMKTRELLNKLDLHTESLITRMTGCPNGCSRPYMAELALVGELLYLSNMLSLKYNLLHKMIIIM